MLTPGFELTQSDDFLEITIKVPYAKVSETDVYFENYDFKFFCKPYFLRLNLPGKVIYCEEPDISYDVSSGTFSISMPKETKGEVFEGLDFLTKLLATKSQPNTKIPNIEVIGDVHYDDDEEDDFNWEIEQPIMDEEILGLLEAKCGFANSYPCYVFKLQEESAVLFDVKDLDKTSQLERIRQRIKMEVDDFSEDHYVADLDDDEEIRKIIKYKPDWVKLFNQAPSSPEDDYDSLVHFTMEEKERLRNLPNKEYLINRETSKSVYLGLVDILFAYAYDKRVNEGESNVESGWNINKLSATLSWLEAFPSLKFALESGLHRSLVYPLYRNWRLAKKVLEDTKIILSLGRKYVLKCFLDIHKLFCTSDPRYILNDLFITDYCVWIQGKGCKSETLKKLAKDMDLIIFTKQDLHLDVCNLEMIYGIARKAMSNNTLKFSLDSSNEEDSKEASGSLCASMSSIKIEEM